MEDWIERDSAWFGDYLPARIYPKFGFYKNYDDDNRRFVLQVRLATGEPDAVRRLELLAVRALNRLEAIRVIDALPAERYD
jgi:hypothetical protein